MKYCVYQDMFLFVTHGIISVKDADIISVQPMEDDVEASNVFFWIDGPNGEKIVDALLEVAVFDNKTDAYAWVVADLPGFIDIVKVDQEVTKSMLKEMKDTLKQASKCLDAARKSLAKPKKLKAAPK